MKKRMTALLLALLMICSLLPLGAVAAQTPEDEQLAVIAGNALEDNTAAITATVGDAPETVHHVAKRAGSYSELIMAPTMENMAAVAGQKVVFEFIADCYGSSTQAPVVEIYKNSLADSNFVSGTVLNPFPATNNLYEYTVTWDSKGNGAGTYYLVFGTANKVNNQWQPIDGSFQYFTFELTKSARALQSLSIRDMETDAQVSSKNMRVSDGVYDCYVAFNPKNTTAQRAVTASSSNVKVAKVDTLSGILYIQPVGPGSCKIVAYAGGKQVALAVNVTSPATSISLDKTSASMHAGEKLTLKATVQPAGCTDKVVWASSNPTVASVSNGVVTANYGGTVTITATAGNYKASCQVKISQHEFTSVESELSCTTPDATIRTCKICGKVEKEIRTPALGHDWDYGTIVKEATEDTNGLLEWTCQRCGKKKQTVIPATGDECDGGENCPSTKFTDAPAATNWAHEGIDFAVSRGLLSGTTDTTFEPAKPMQRAMLVAVLWRLDGRPEPTGKNTFTDVKAGSYYEKAVIWASTNAIVAGVGQNRFNPTGNVTREQIAAFFFRYARFKDYDVYTHNDISTFPDADKVSAYAKESLSWATAEGLISGMATSTNVILNPKGNATRAQVAAIMMRFCYRISGDDLSDRIG